MAVRSNCTERGSDASPVQYPPPTPTTPSRRCRSWPTLAQTMNGRLFDRPGIRRITLCHDQLDHDARRAVEAELRSRERQVLLDALLIGRLGQPASRPRRRSPTGTAGGSIRHRYPRDERRTLDRHLDDAGPMGPVQLVGSGSMGNCISVRHGVRRSVHQLVRGRRRRPGSPRSGCRHFRGNPYRRGPNTSRCRRPRQRTHGRRACRRGTSHR